ncbi:MAG: saccharopine dehydrogenase NADP-binding domain-containing protein [Armatimonadetes bacterium]|nr:saccharopine dehydrogenase NADP-binding domain-containing protein [Armatimonadota bacterium]
MKYTYAVLGAGMQGTAAAYDLAKFGDAKNIKMGDMSLDQAHKSASRVNLLTGAALCEAHQVNALKTESLGEFLAGVDVLLSCVPYWMHPQIAKVAIELGVNMCDLGGNTDVTMETLHMDEAAKTAGVTLVPDTGLAPGLVNSLGMYLMEQMDKPESVSMYCGVLPQNPVPPLNYKVTFNVEGLVTEYDYEAVALRDNEIIRVPTLTELEELEIDGMGKMEAFVTSGGTSTAPYTFKDKITNYQYKTIRFPGHCAQIKLFKDFGLWREDEIVVPGGKVKPKDVFCAVFGPELSKFVDKDQCFVRGVGTGTKDGKTVRKQVDIHDKECEKTGFTSMERLTGFSMAIYAKEIADGNVTKGAVRYETAITGTKFVEEIQRRGVVLKFS